MSYSKLRDAFNFSFNESDIAKENQPATEKSAYTETTINQFDGNSFLEFEQCTYVNIRPVECVEELNISDPAQENGFSISDLVADIGQGLLGGFAAGIGQAVAERAIGGSGEFSGLPVGEESIGEPLMSADAVLNIDPPEPGGLPAIECNPHPESDFLSLFGDGNSSFGEDSGLFDTEASPFSGLVSICFGE